MRHLRKTKSRKIAQFCTFASHPNAYSYISSLPGRGAELCAPTDVSGMPTRVSSFGLGSIQCRSRFIPVEPKWLG